MEHLAPLEHLVDPVDLDSLDPLATLEDLETEDSLDHLDLGMLLGEAGLLSGFLDISVQGNSGPMVLHRCIAIATCINMIRAQNYGKELPFRRKCCEKCYLSVPISTFLTGKPQPFSINRGKKKVPFRHKT